MLAISGIHAKPVASTPVIIAGLLTKVYRRLLFHQAVGRKLTKQIDKNLKSPFFFWPTELDEFYLSCMIFFFYQIQPSKWPKNVIFFF